MLTQRILMAAVSKMAGQRPIKHSDVRRMLEPYVALASRSEAIPVRAFAAMFERRSAEKLPVV